MKKPLSKLHKVDLREVWGHEAIDFTTWLAQQENFDILSEEIGIDIKLIQTEANVGKFSVDILAEEEASHRKIIIENQLEETNHDHLGKIITYASGYDAEIIIWIVKNVRDEHQRAVEWLNEHTDENINFFLIRIELWQISDSNPAPKFDIIVSPNEWAKTIKAIPRNNELTNTNLQQLDFWEKFKEYVRKKDTVIRLQTPKPKHYYDFTLGSSDAFIELTVNKRDNFISCELYIPDNMHLFDFLNEQKEAIEKELGEPGSWWRAKKASSIRIKKLVTDVFNQEQYDSYFAWLFEKTKLFQKCFGKYIKQFKS